VRTLILGSNTVIVINYLLLALNGYAMFCSSTKPNILESLGDAFFHRVGPGSDTWLGKFKHYAVLSARVSLAVQLTLALPMRFFVARKTVVGDALSLPMRVITSGGLVVSATILAILPISLATVLGIVSSICASMIIYILPAFVDLRLRLPGTMRIGASAVSLLVGTFILTAGFLANLFGVAVPGG